SSFLPIKWLEKRRPRSYYATEQSPISDYLLWSADGRRRCGPSQSAVYRARIKIPITRLRSDLYYLFRYPSAASFKCKRYNIVRACCCHKSKRLLTVLENY